MAKSKVKKGSVYTGKSVKNKMLPKLKDKDKIEKKSKQKTSAKTEWLRQNGLISPPFSPDILLTLYESNSTLLATINQVAQDVAGLGYNVTLKEGKEENQTELDRINILLEKPNDEDELRNLLKMFLIDWGSIGYFGIEVVRNNIEEIVELYHVPAHTIRVHKDKEKYCQIRDNKKVWFKKFGIEKNFSAIDGREGNFSIEERANELIFYKNFYPKSDYYGAPNSISSTGDIFSLIGVRDYNLNFFENYGVPASVIVLEGEWEEESDKKISKFIDTELKGADNSHRTMVILQPEGCKFNYNKLSTEIKDGSFLKYQQQLKENILVAYSMPAERVGVTVSGPLGGSRTDEATRIYIQAVVEPLQTDLESIINNKILQSESYEFKFNNLDTKDDDALSKRLVEEVKSGIKTPNEARKELGLVAYEDGDKFYMQAGLIEVGEMPDENALTKEEDKDLDNHGHAEEE